MSDSRRIVLQTRDLTAGYRHKREPQRVIDDLTVELRAGELVCLLGPNGAGKSTLLRTLAGMQRPLSGTVELLGSNVHALSADQRARLLSVVLTEPVNVGLLTGYDLVALGRYPYTSWAGDLTEADESVVQNAIAAVGGAKLATRHIHTLSDGERQKMLIARALAQEPALMLLDEPTAFLDLPRRVEMMHLLRRLARTTGRTFLLSTHDLDLALRNADRVWLLPDNGRLVDGAPEDLILNGHFGDAFRSEGVWFDVQTGAFTAPQSSSNRPVTVQGDGIAALWTRRALERVGFRVTSTTDAAVAIRAESGTWHIRHGEYESEHPSIHTLLETLTTQFPGLS